MIATYSNAHIHKSHLSKAENRSQPILRHKWLISKAFLFSFSLLFVTGQNTIEDMVEQRHIDTIQDTVVITPKPNLSWFNMKFDKKCCVLTVICYLIDNGNFARLDSNSLRWGCQVQKKISPLSQPKSISTHMAT